MTTEKKLISAFALFMLAGCITDCWLHKYANAGFIGGFGVLAAIYLTYPDKEA